MNDAPNNNDIASTLALAPHDNSASLTVAWALLFLLTLVSLGLGEWFHAADWLPLLVAGIVWFKGAVVARCFIESHESVPFIARLLQIFIALAPLALILTAFFGRHVVRWVTL
jgi:hypothetical protein